MKKLSRRVMSVLLTLYMMAGLLPKLALSAPGTAQNLTEATTITDKSSDLLSGDVKITENGSYIFQNVTTQNSITVEAGVKAEIKLENVSIQCETGSAFDIKVGSTVKLTIEGTNTLNGGDGKAGLHVVGGAALTINGTEGILEARGSLYSAGIGANNILISAQGIREDFSARMENEYKGDITINGGNIFAIGGSVGGTGIGGGSYG